MKASWGILISATFVLAATLSFASWASHLIGWTPGVDGPVLFEIAILPSLASLWITARAIRLAPADDLPVAQVAEKRRLKSRYVRKRVVMWACIKGCCVGLVGVAISLAVFVVAGLASLFRDLPVGG